MTHRLPEFAAIHRRQALLLAAGAGLALSGCGHLAVAAPGAAASADQGFDAWAENFAARWVRQSAERASVSQYFEGAEQAALDRELTPRTKAHRAATRRLAQEGLRQVRQFEAASLSDTQRVGAAILRWSLQQQLAAEPFDDHQFAFNQLRGSQVSLVSFMSNMHPMRRSDDVDAYLSRLSQAAQRLDETLQQSRLASTRGLLPPNFILERSRTQVRDLLAPEPAQNLLVVALERRTARMPGLSPEARQQAISTATRLVEEQLLPAWRRLDAYLAELQPRTTADAGLWRLPQGAAAYAQALANYTSTALTADEIHALGLREVARIEGEMHRVLQDMGRTQGTVQQRMVALRASLQPPAEPDPRPGLIQKFSDYVVDARRRSQPLFNLQPAAPIEVRRVPPLTEKTAAAHYTTPAPDGSLPGVFWAPLPGPTYNIPGMRSLAVHEAVPGHHFQLAIQQEQATLPRWRQRRIFGGGSAHSEGWALYAERLAIDEGWYEGDTVSLLGALDSQLFRARRLVVDTGLHAKRWTREQAIAYGISAQEVERYVSNPGQACAYMVGMLHILKLRGEAQATLGSKFDIKAFHDVVLTTGSVPLDVLGEVINRWVKRGGTQA